jgi:hypothetical protein
MEKSLEKMKMSEGKSREMGRESNHVYLFMCMNRPIYSTACRVSLGVFVLRMQHRIVSAVRILSFLEPVVSFLPLLLWSI